jgi:hypothetical protein
MLSSEATVNVSQPCFPQGSTRCHCEAVPV